jgi:riboflavin transporter 2
LKQKTKVQEISRLYFIFVSFILKIKNFKKYLKNRLFGIGTWLNLNGIWIELPLLIPQLSEGWALSPQLGLASNIVNIGPLIIALIRLIIDKSSSYEVPSICVIFGVGISIPIILSFTWSKQVFLFGKTRSVHLLILGCFVALVNCTSSVIYLHFVNRFDHKWLNIYFAGESLSSLIPAMLGLAQVNFILKLCFFN